MANVDDGTFDIVAIRGELLEHPSNDFETLTNLMKGMIGIGLFGMPYAFKFSGLLTGLIAGAVVIALSAYGVFLLAHSVRELYTRLNIPFLSYGELARKSFENGPEKLRVLATAATITSEVLLWINMFGCCVTYTIFIAATLLQVVVQNQPEMENYFGIRWFISFMFLPLLLLVLIRHLKYLSYVSLMANIVMLSGCVCTIYFLLRPPINPISSRPYVESIIKFPIFVSITLFGVACMAVILSLENNMKNSRHLVTIPGIICGNYCFAYFLYAGLGFCGFLKYGDQTKASIILNLPEDEIISQVVKITLAFGVLITYCLQFYVGIEIMIKYLENKYGKLKTKWVILMRELICAASVIVAWLVPSIGGIMALIGAIACSVLGLIFPAIFDLLLFYNNPKCIVLRYIINFLLILVGFTTLLCGSYMSVLEIIEDLGFK